MVLLLGLVVSSPVLAQGTGTIFGRVLDAQSGAALEGAEVRVDGGALRTLTAQEGRFVLVGVPAGERTLAVTLLGYREATLGPVLVRGGRSTEVTIELTPAALEVEGVTVEAERRVPLIEPEIRATHEVVLGRELRALPVDAVEQAVELAPGVSDGHFRGGRIGQESYVVDGIELKNQLEASTQGLGLEFSPTSLEEVEVVTGGFGAQYGSALSGVVRYVTRRGDPEEWRARASLTTDHWAPDAVFRGFTGLSLSAGGPLDVLGEGTTLFADVLLQGMYDADPRARGMTCLEPGDADDALAAAIRDLSADAQLAGLYCPYTGATLPHQRGDKWIGFVRLDRPITEGLTFTTSLLSNRFQRQLYTPEFKYNREHQLGQRTTGGLATAALDWTRHRQGSAVHVSARAAAMRLDRYLGALDPWSTGERTDVAGFGWADYRFLGEERARLPIEEQLARREPLPGYEAPGGAVGSPFGPAGEGIFVTAGTPDLANWARTRMLGADLVGEVVGARGHTFRAGGAAKFYEVASYERVRSHLAGSSPSFARFYPATLSAFAEGQFGLSDEITFELGVRVEGFRSGIAYRADRTDFLSPTLDSEWKLSFMPRFGAAMPVPGTDGRTTVRFNYGRVSQPPDFRYFLDTTIGDSLRTDIRRQGNPNLGFEKGHSYEMGVAQMVGERASIGLTLFRKTLENLVTGAAARGEVAPGRFTTGDFGRVDGVELTLRARWPGLEVRGGWALQKAVGVGSGTAGDSIRSDSLAPVEYPLAFDRRHAGDLAVFAGSAAGGDQAWGAVLVGQVKSGYPLDRVAAGGGLDGPFFGELYLPWTATVDLRASYELGELPGCGGCRWRVVADGRNVLGRENIIALRRDTGLLAPTLEDVTAVAERLPRQPEPIPRESPAYSEQIDFDGNGVVSPEEYRSARFAAALDRYDPSLYFGEARQVRLGVEVTF